MGLKEYHDEFVQAELGSEFGSYATSFSGPGGLVEVHLFRRANSRVAFVTKDANVPVRMAQQLVYQAVALLSDEWSAAKTVVDSGSIPVSGRL